MNRGTPLHSLSVSLVACAAWGCQRATHGDTSPATATPVVKTPSLARGASREAAAPLASPEPSAAASGPSVAPAAPVIPLELLVQTTSAYAASLSVGSDSVYLQTEHEVYSLAPGRTPKEQPLEGGHAAVLNGGSFVSWQAGAFWRTPKNGGKAELLVKHAASPSKLRANGDTVAWTTKPDKRPSVLSVLQGGKLLAPFADDVPTTALVLGQGVAYLVQQRPQEWAAARVTFDGVPARFSAASKGVAPTVIALGDKVYVYASTQRQLLAFALDLQQSEVIATGVLCANLAVESATAYCASEQGVFAIALRAPHAVRLLVPAGAVITGIALGPRGLAWINDSATNELSVSLVGRADLPL